MDGCIVTGLVRGALVRDRSFGPRPQAEELAGESGTRATPFGSLRPSSFRVPSTPLFLIYLLCHAADAATTAGDGRV